MRPGRGSNENPANLLVVGKKVITQSVDTPHNLSFIRGVVASNGSITSGEGFIVGLATNVFTITFHPGFMDVPSVVFSPIYTPGTLQEIARILASSLSKTGVTITTLLQSAGSSNTSATAIGFSFQAIGVRSQ